MQTPSAASLGLVTAAEVRALGRTASSLRRRLASGDLEWVARGLLAGNVALSGHERWLREAHISQHRAGPSSLLSAQAAAALYGLDGFEPPVPITVNVGPCGPRAKGTRRVRHCGEPVQILGLAVADIITTLFDLSVDLAPFWRWPGDPSPIEPFERVELAVEAAIREGYLSDAELRNAVAAVDGRRPGQPVVRAILRGRPPGAPPTESYLETRMLQAMRVGALPEPLRQVEIRDDTGLFVARVDFLLDRVVVETDGLEYHDSPTAFQRDRERWRALQVLGFQVLAFTNRDIERRPGRSIRQVEEAVRAGRKNLRTSP